MIEVRPVETDEDVDTFLAVRRAIDPQHTIERAAYLRHRDAPGRIDVLARRGDAAGAAARLEPHAAAKAAGLRQLRTTTALANAPMLHVNERLGYRRGVAWVHLRGPLLDLVSP
jgi:hypothetical protein